MYILGIETSCDDTAIGVINEEGFVLSNIIASQNEFHNKYKGIVPEIASRRHLATFSLVLQESLRTANITIKDIDLISVTYGPGLIGSLLIGVESAKILSFLLEKPIVGVNHLEGHIYSAFLKDKTYSNENIEFPFLEDKEKFPFLVLIVSGGHTDLVLMEKHLNYNVIGSTRDDAAGEALDKFAKVLGLGYPGGPIIEKLAKTGNDNFHTFPSLSFKGSPYEFSFSGLKTAGIYFVRTLTEKEIKAHLNDLACSFEKAVCDILSERSYKAIKEFKPKNFIVVGGVAANERLRKEFLNFSKYTKVFFPKKVYCTDNGVMIAKAGFEYYKMKKTSCILLDAVSRLTL